jgi:integrase
MPLLPAVRGGYTARKQIPLDVRDEYERLYGSRHEAWFNSGPVGMQQAKALHRDWLSLVESQIANIRAARTGNGSTLTPQGARALAGEWYRWFIQVMSAKGWSAATWREYRERAWDDVFHSSDPPQRDWSDVDLNYLRPLVADEGKTAQFLAAKQLQLDTPSRDLFLNNVVRDFFAAVDTLTRRAEGDYKDDYQKRFPKADAIDSGLSPWALFESWVKKTEPAASTINRWRGVFLKLQEDHPTIPLAEQAHEWAMSLVNSERSAATVRNVWVIACRTVFAWALGAKLVTSNPFVGWRIAAKRKISTRETKSFTPKETATILRAANEIKVVGNRTMTAAKRWTPWLAAYSGARMGELTQLRGTDVFQEGRIWAVKISPEAGTVKNRQPRSVPLHRHLIEMGFLDFVKASGSGALFYNETSPRKSIGSVNDPTKPQRHRAVKTRERMAAWVREIGVTDTGIQPNHAWRHTFKKIGDRAGISEKMLDAICGHAPASEGRRYGEAELPDKARALRRFPRFKI